MDTIQLKIPVVCLLEASASSPGAARQAAAGGDGRLGCAASPRLSRPAGGAGGVDELLLFFLFKEAAGQTCVKATLVTKDEPECKWAD